jgi:hypothetical protein
VVVVPPCSVVDGWVVVVPPCSVVDGWAGCSVVVVAGGTAASRDPPNHPADQPMMSTKTITTITPMTVFLEFMSMGSSYMREAP